ncbi:MAG: hypothetical protein U0169_00710 [Polyangiaceae bacterium]
MDARRPPLLLKLDQVRIDRAGDVAIEGLSFEVPVGRVLVACASPLVFEAVAGVRVTRSGTVRFGDRDVRACVDGGTWTSAPFDPPMPGTWSVRDYVESGASLAGVPRSRVRASADGAMSRLGIASAAKTKLAKAPKGLRRGTVLAAALATDADVLVVDDPTSDLADDERAIMVDIFVRAAGDRSFVVFTPRLAATSPWASHVDSVVVFRGSEARVLGSVAEVASVGSSYTIRFDGPRDAFERELRAGGAEVHDAGRPDTFDVRVSGDPGSVVLFEAAKRATTRILELASSDAAFS